MTRRPSKKLLRPFVALLLGFVIIPVMVAPSFAEDVQKTLKKQPYEGSRDRNYIVHLPPSYDPAARPLPLVMVLHGCNEDHETIKHDTNFDAVADQENFIAVYPFITTYDGTRSKNCWGFWMDHHIHKGKGEVEDLAAIVREVQSGYRVDPNHIHITGVSSGGGMTVDALVAHSELFASGAPTAGLPYSETDKNWMSGTFKPIDEYVNAMDKEMGAQKRPVPIFIIHSTSDTTVKIGYGEKIRDSWGKAFGVDTTDPIDTPKTGNTKGTNWTYTKYGKGPDGNTVVETLFVECLKHGWYGDRDGQYAFSNAPDSAKLAWEFFKAHTMRPECLKDVTAKSAADNESGSIRVEGKVVYDCPLDNQSKVTVKVELLGLAPQEARPAQFDASNKTYTYESQKHMRDNTYYRPQVTAADATGITVTALGDPVPLGLPPTTPPALTIDCAKGDLKRVSLAGGVRDEVGVVSVEVRFDNKKWLPAVINHDTWSYDGSGLPAGSHSVEVRAMNKAALDTITSTKITPLDPYDASQLSDFSAHLTASRIRSYANGFGSADKGVAQLLQEYGPTQPFRLYRARNTDDWYAEVVNIPFPEITPCSGSVRALPRTQRPATARPMVVKPCCP